MQSATILEIGSIVASLIALLAVGYEQWRRWRTGKAAPRQEQVTGSARRLVEAAEQLFREPGQGKLKFAWVMGRLQKRFPERDWDELVEYMEQAVLRLNRYKHPGGR